jgi:hypothetical protein
MYDAGLCTPADPAAPLIEERCVMTPAAAISIIGSSWRSANGDQADNERDGAGTGPRPDPDRRKETLEAFPLDSMKMVGTLGTGERVAALVLALVRGPIARWTRRGLGFVALWLMAVVPLTFLPSVLDIATVRYLAQERGRSALAVWVDRHPREYARGVLDGFRAEP